MMLLFRERDGENTYRLEKYQSDECAATCAHKFYIPRSLCLQSGVLSSPGL